MRLLLGIVGIALLWGGGQGLYTGLTNLEPTELTCREYYADPPRAKWVRLSGCKASVMESAHEESLSGSIERMYVPLYPADLAEDEEVEVAVLLSSEDARFKDPYVKLGSVSEEEMLTTLLTNFDQYYFETEVTGLVRFGIELNDDEVDQLESLDMGLSEDFVILDDDEEPALGRSIAFFLGGLLALLGSIASFFLKRRG